MERSKSEKDAATLINLSLEVCALCKEYNLEFSCQTCMSGYFAVKTIGELKKELKCTTQS